MSRLAQLHEKRIALDKVAGEGSRDANLHRIATFWQDLAADPKFPTLLWPTVFRFQMALAEIRLERAPEVGNQSLEDCLDFWIEQFDQHPNDRRCVQFVRTLTQRRIRNQFDEGDLNWFETRLHSHPVFAITLGDHFVQEEKYEQAIRYYRNQEWRQAIEVYDSLITDQTTDANLLSRRAQAHAALEQWDRARADWSRATQLDPSRLNDAFKYFRNAEQWSVAAEFGRRLVEENPEESMNWMRVSTVIFLSGDETGYAEFCQWIAEQPAETSEQAERAIKSSLLGDSEFDIAALPADALTEALESGNHPELFAPWGWATRGLLAYRSGDVGLAVKYINRSNEHAPDGRVSAMNQSILAMALHEQSQPDEAQAALAKALLLPKPCSSSIF